MTTPLPEAEPHISGGTANVDALASEMASMAAANSASAPSIMSLATTAEERALARARELAVDQAARQQMRKAVELAAERLVSKASPQKMAPLPDVTITDPVARRAALRERVREQ